MDGNVDQQRSCHEATSINIGLRGPEVVQQKLYTIADQAKETQHDQVTVSSELRQ